jgi:N-acetylglucosaminyl-diphospho-decaprenol L-rhamnosyltransferase
LKSSERLDSLDPKIVVSVVSHNQGQLVAQLLTDLERHCGGFPLTLILTLNTSEYVPFRRGEFFPLHIIQNKQPKGFGQNHNAAFHEGRGDYFCVVNPDIRLVGNPFPALLEALEDKRVAIAAPLVTDAQGRVEDSARRIPTPYLIAKKLFRRKTAPDYDIANEFVYPDWVGGMFMLFPWTAYERLGGFDERYFLYYEDVDLCCRARLSGYEIVLNPTAHVIHEARRGSHRSPKYSRLHLASMIRFFTSPVFFAALRRRRTRLVDFLP